MARARSKEDISTLLELNFNSCVPSDGGSGLVSCVKDALIMAQKMAGFQFTITSAYRSQAWER